MEERRVADYFVVAGLPPNPEPLEDFSSEGISVKCHQAPITDIAVIFRNLDEAPPPGFYVLDTTVSGLCADLNHGSIRSPNVFLCYRRGRDKPPLVDIGVLYDGKERVLPDSDVIFLTPNGRPANVNNSGSKTYITYRRASETAPCNELVVMDICVTLTNKGEIPPHTFCTIPKNLNKGMVGSDVYLCYKKSMNKAKSIAYKPAVLEQFPIMQHDDFDLPPSVPLFCLPMGATVECWPAKARNPAPVFSTFVLTSHTVEKVYGAAVTFYERLSSTITAEQKQTLCWDDTDETLNANKCICILSRWPFFDTFEKFLRFLYRTSISGSGSSQVIPVERYISHFMLEVPFPSAQRPRILIQLNNTERLSLAQPEDSPLPLSGASFQNLLKNLSADDCLLLLLFALTEQKILIHSLRPDVLTSVAEAVLMMIFPFHWQCPYIPLCPLGLSDVLSAPMAFIVGVDSRYFDLYDPPNDITCVDLDTNTISVAEEKKSISIKLLPKKPARILRSTIISIMERMKQLDNRAKQQQYVQTQENQTIERDFKLKREERAIELDIQEAFLRFTASVLKGFRSFLQPITQAPTIAATDCSSLFDVQGFLKSRDKAHHRFYNLLVKTQMFCRFIEERSFVSDKDVSLAFFDECTEKIDVDLPEKEFRLLEADVQSERTVFILPPEPIEADVAYTCGGFGNLNASFYHEKQFVRTWLSPLSKFAPTPGSPLAKRTKQEIKSARQIAKRHSEKPILWSKCLVSYCYTLWFVHLPAFVQSHSSKAKALHTAYDILVGSQSVGLHPPDEVCYRVLMQLCGQYSQPVLAVKLLAEMKRNGIQPNAITYGFYNKAVYESTWPACNTNAYLLWNKLRNVIIGVALLKRGSRPRPSDSDCEDGASTGYNSMNTDETQKSSSSISSTPNEVDALASKAKVNRILRFEDVDFAESDHLRSRLRTIVRSSVSCLGSASRQDIVDSSAGVLMTGSTSTCYDEEFGNAIGLRWHHRHVGSAPRHRRTLLTLSDPCDERVLRSDSFGNDAQILSSLKKPSAENSPNSWFTPKAAAAALPKVTRSATFCHSPELNSEVPARRIYRSSSAALTEVPNSLASASFSGLASLKLALTQSPRKDILGSLKSAATSVASKLSEIREAISTTGINKSFEEATAPTATEMVEIDCGTTKQAMSEDLAPREIEAMLDEAKRVRSLVKNDCKLPSSASVEILMNTCSRCHTCGCVLYDEEIMSNWTAEDSNLNTRCQFCDNKLVPLLIVTIRDFRDTVNNKLPEIAEDDETGSLASSRASSKGSIESRESFNVPYLSPIVLRKELENVLDHEGDACLSEPRFVDEHPIIYWNLIWFFERVHVPSHMIGLFNSGESGNIIVRCLWDNVKLHEEMGQPMYILWNQNAAPSPLISALLTEQRPLNKNLLQRVLTNISHNDMTESVRLLLVNIQKDPLLRRRRISIYRDILFLVVAAVGRENISLSSIEREYRFAYEKLLPLFGQVIRPVDRPPSLGAILCRNAFGSLEL
uniref:UDENN domain-containing protein n=1 Tax=Strigamia maritima TaxID=126957 RepID=T1IU82_STRMM